MKGADGTSKHESVYFSSAADGGTIIAAPPLGFYICVFKIMGTFGSTTVVTMHDGAATYWGLTTQGLRPFLDRDDCGVFAVAEAQPLILGNAGTLQVRLNITYEYRPVGV